MVAIYSNFFYNVCIALQRKCDTFFLFMSSNDDLAFIKTYAVLYIISYLKPIRPELNDINSDSHKIIHHDYFYSKEIMIE